jgi:hypothetical protein
MAGLKSCLHLEPTHSDYQWSEDHDQKITTVDPSMACIAVTLSQKSKTQAVSCIWTQHKGFLNKCLVTLLALAFVNFTSANKMISFASYLNKTDKTSPPSPCLWFPSSATSHIVRSMQALPSNPKLNRKKQSE